MNNNRRIVKSVHLYCVAVHPWHTAECVWEDVNNRAMSLLRFTFQCVWEFAYASILSPETTCIALRFMFKSSSHLSYSTLTAVRPANCNRVVTTFSRVRSPAFTLESSLTRSLSFLPLYSLSIFAQLPNLPFYSSSNPSNCLVWLIGIWARLFRIICPNYPEVHALNLGFFRLWASFTFA